MKAGLALKHRFTDSATTRRLGSDRGILVGAIASGQLAQAVAVVTRLAETAPRDDYPEIGRIAQLAHDRLQATGNIQTTLPYLCQLAVEIDRALAQRTR